MSGGLSQIHSRPKYLDEDSDHFRFIYCKWHTFDEKLYLHESIRSNSFVSNQSFFFSFVTFPRLKQIFNAVKESKI